MKKRFKPLWITYFIQLIPAVFSFIFLSVFSFNMMLTDIFKVPYSSSVWNFYGKIYESLFIVDELNIIIRTYICVLLCAVGAVILAVLGKNIFSKKDKIALFLPYILAVLTVFISLSNDLYIAMAFSLLAFLISLIAIEIHIPVKLKKLQKVK